MAKAKGYDYYRSCRGADLLTALDAVADFVDGVPYIDGAAS